MNYRKQVPVLVYMHQLSFWCDAYCVTWVKFNVTCMSDDNNCLWQFLYSTSTPTSALVDVHAASDDFKYTFAIHDTFLLQFCQTSSISHRVDALVSISTLQFWQVYIQMIVVKQDDWFSHLSLSSVKLNHSSSDIRRESVCRRRD